MAGDLLEYPVDIVNDQSKTCVVHTGAKSVRPPQKAHYHKKYPIRATAVKIFKRKILREWIVCWRPLLAAGGLDGFPPLDDLVAKFVRVDIIAAREVPSVSLVTGDLNRAGVAWESDPL